MKRIGGLFERIHAAENLVAAACKAARGKRSRPPVRAFLARLEENVAEIGRAIRTGRLSFDPTTSFDVRDPKSRTIRAPSFRDRVVHHALISITGPVFERGAINASHACRLRRGQAAALALARRRVPHAEAFLKLDVAKFYDSIEHCCLEVLLRRRFREERLLELFDRLLQGYATAPGRGLPIGALTSQYLGNFMLDPFDHWAARQPAVAGYQRYMDDMLFFGQLADLRRLRHEAIARLGLFGLEVKEGGVLNRTALGVPWLGFTLYPDRVRMDARARRRLGRRHAALQRDSRRGLVTPRGQQARATALFAHAAAADDLGWRRALLARTRHREALEPGEPRRAGRLLEQPGQELPLGQPQQEEARQPQQEPGLPRLPAPRHGDAGHGCGQEPPDDAPSCAPDAPAAGDESCGRTPAGAKIQGTPNASARCPEENAPAGAPPRVEAPR